MAKNAEAQPIAVPTSILEVEAYESRIKECLETIEVNEQKLEDLSHEIDTQDDLAARYAEAIYQYSIANRTTLLPKGDKTVKLPRGGTFGWVNSTRILISGKVESTINWFKKHRLKKRFVRVKVEETINKEALHDAPDELIKRIPHVSRVTGELFKVSPSGRPDHLERDFENGTWKRKSPKEKKIQPFAQAAE